MPHQNVAVSPSGNPSDVIETSSVLLCAGWTSSSVSCGRASMSSDHAHTTPSVEAETSELAFWVPSKAREYTGCVWPEVESGVFSTAFACRDRVSHRRIWPE